MKVSLSITILIGLFLGFIIGGYIPAIWGDSVFSISSVIFGSIGGIFGIWIGFKLGQS